MIVQPVVQVSMCPLVRKTCSSTNQQICAGGSSQWQVPSTQSSKQQHHTIKDDEDEDLETELSDAESCHKPQSKQKACKFRNEDLPGLPKTGAPFRNIVIPQWIFYFSALDSPWKLANSEHVMQVQKIWDQTFPDVLCTFILHDEPIFALYVCSFVQHSYLHISRSSNGLMTGGKTFHYVHLKPLKLFRSLRELYHHCSLVTAYLSRLHYCHTCGPQLRMAWKV